MRKLSIRHFARFLSIHPNWSLFVALLLTGISLFSIRNLEIKMDMAELLPDDLEVVKITESALQDFGTFDFMLVVLEIDDEKNRHLLTEGAEELAYGLNYDEYIRDVTYRIDTESLKLDTKAGKARALALLTPEDWDSLGSKLSTASIEQSMARLQSLLNAIPPSRYETVLKDPLNFSTVIAERTEIKSGPLKVNLLDNYFISDDGEILLMLVWPWKPSTDLNFAQDFQEFLEGTKEGVYVRRPEFVGQDAENPDLRISFYGSHYETITDSKLIENDFYRTSIISFCAVLLLFFIAFRRPEALLFVIVPLVMGVVWTLGFATVSTGRLTQVTIAFAAILIGLGIDFSVHLYSRFLEERKSNLTPRESLRLAIEGSGPSIIAGAITTAIAFLGMTITSFEGFRELGFIASVGVLACLLAVLLVLPAMLSLMGDTKIGRFGTRPMSEFGLRRFQYTASAYPRVTIIGALVITAFLGTYAVKIGFQDDYRKLQQPTKEYVDLQNRISSHFEVPSDQLILISKGVTAQDALETNDELFNTLESIQTVSSLKLIAVDSLRYFIPSKATQRNQLQRMTQFDLEQVRATVDRSARDNNLNPAIFEDFFGQLQDFQDAATDALGSDIMPIDIEKLGRRENLPLSKLAQRYTYKSDEGNWRVMTQVYPPATEEWEVGIPEVFKDAIFNNPKLKDKVEITGAPIIQEEIRNLLVRELAFAVFIVMLAVMIVLIIYFRSFSKASFALIPVIIGIICTLGIMELLNMELHYLNIISLPMIVGIGVDSGIHMIHRYYENDKHSLKETVRGTGRAVVITSLTTIFGFGSLALADYQGIRDLGIVSILGVGCTLIASLIVVPSLLYLSQSGLEHKGDEGDEIG